LSLLRTHLSIRSGDSFPGFGLEVAITSPPEVTSRINQIAGTKPSSEGAEISCGWSFQKPSSSFDGGLGRFPTHSASICHSILQVVHAPALWISPFSLGQNCFPVNLSLSTTAMAVGWPLFFFSSRVIGSLPWSEKIRLRFLGSCLETFYHEMSFFLAG